MSEFWIGATWASGFWVLAYAGAVVTWAILDVRRDAREMPNTEAANDRAAYWNPKEVRLYLNQKDADIYFGLPTAAARLEFVREKQPRFD